LIEIESTPSTKRLASNTAYGTGRFLAFVTGVGIIPHVLVWDMSRRHDGTLLRSEFRFDSRRNVYICPQARR
jgi:hypothetical protein